MNSLTVRIAVLYLAISVFCVHPLHAEPPPPPDFPRSMLPAEFSRKDYAEPAIFTVSKGDFAIAIEIDGEYEIFNEYYVTDANNSWVKRRFSAREKWLRSPVSAEIHYADLDEGQRYITIYARSADRNRTGGWMLSDFTITRGDRPLGFCASNADCPVGSVCVNGFCYRRPPWPGRPRGLYAYANTHDVVAEGSEEILLYSNAPDPVEYTIISLPDEGSLYDDGNMVSSVPHSVQGNDVRYFLRSGYFGPDHFEYEVKSGSKTGHKASIFLSVVDSTVAEDGPHEYYIPAIPKTWWEDPELYPAPDDISKERYEELINAYHSEIAWARRSAGDPALISQDNFAYVEAFLYETCKDDPDSLPDDCTVYRDYAVSFLKGYLQRVQDLIDQGANTIVDFDYNLALKTYYILMENGAVPEADQPFFQEAFLNLDTQLENVSGPSWPPYGANVYAMQWASMRRWVALLFPGASGHENRMEYFNHVWSDWWDYRDVNENASNYNARFFLMACTMMDVLDKQMYQEPGMEPLADRYLSQVTPMGIMPNHGAGLGFNQCPGLWIAVFEKWATEYRDGRFKWAAHRTFDWTTSRPVEMRQWTGTYDATARELIDAYRAADDSIDEVAPGESSLNKRKRARITTPVEYIETGYPLYLFHDKVPDKLILRSGDAPTDLYAFVELYRLAGHGHCDIGSINLLAAGGSVLLSDTPYHVVESQFHNNYQLHTEGGCWCNRCNCLDDMSLDVLTFRQEDDFSYAEYEVENYLGRHARWNRSIFFVPNQFLWVHDVLRAEEDLGSCTIGPSWNTGAIYGAMGKNWVNTAIPRLPLSETRAVEYMVQWSNHPYDLLILFPERDKLQVDYVGVDDTQKIAGGAISNNLRYRIWDRKTAVLNRGDHEHSDSILIPHEPDPNVGHIPRGFELLIDDVNVSVLRFRQSRKHEFYFGINKPGATLRVAGITTNSPLFFAEVQHGQLRDHYHEPGSRFQYSPWSKSYIKYCGDGIKSFGSERCDDGNTITDECPEYGTPCGKVCAANCRKVTGVYAYCGDNNTDETYGEECDDGNNADGDGCSATCRIERTCADLSDGLVGWWRGEGDTMDAISGSDSEVFGDSKFTEGVVGQAFNFPGNGFYFLAPDNDLYDLGPGGEMSYAAWIKNEDTGDNRHTVFSKRSGPEGIGVYLRYENSPVKVDFGCRYGAGDEEAYGTKWEIGAANEWHLFVVTGGGGKITLYADGCLLGAVEIDSSRDYSNDAKLIVGYGEVDPWHFKGQIDELAIWNRILCPAEVTELYEARQLGICE